MAALLAGIGPAKAWEDVPGNKHAEGSDGDISGIETLVESGLWCWPAAADFKPEK